MKNLVTLGAVGVLGFCAYKYHGEYLKRSMAAPEIKQEVLAKPAPQQAVAISQMLEPWYQALFSDLNKSHPEDLVPPLTVARQRIVHAKSLVGPEKGRIYDIGATVLARMIEAAEERTKALEVMLRADMRDKSSLDSKNTIAASNAYFAETQARRWDDEQKRRKVVLDQLLKQLRDAEHQWNSTAAKGNQIDNYELASLQSVTMVIGKSSADKARFYPWRRPYYDKYSGKPYYR